MSERVAIVVDSAASLPPETANDPQLWTVPMQLNIGGQTFLDGHDLSSKEFYRMLPSLDVRPTTSAPSPEAFATAFGEAAKGHSAVVCLTVSRQVSGSYDAAKTAAQRIRVKKLEVIDSESAAGGEGLLAIEALHLAKRGAGLDEVKRKLKSLIPRVRLLAFLDTLYYVWKSGRLPRIAYLGSSLLNIRPLLELADGNVHLIERPRTSRRASDRLLSRMKSDIGDHSIHATVMHGDSSGNAEELLKRVDSEFDCRELFLSQFSPVMGAHTGPGLVGVAWYSNLW